MSAFGAAASYLHRLLLDKELLPLRSVVVYEHLLLREADHITLDSQTLQNLEILVNQKGGSESTLFQPGARRRDLHASGRCGGAHGPQRGGGRGPRAAAQGA
jgi:hypothetical protein